MKLINEEQQRCSDSSSGCDWRLKKSSRQSVAGVQEGEVWSPS